MRSRSRPAQVGLRDDRCSCSGLILLDGRHVTLGDCCDWCARGQRVGGDWSAAFHDYPLPLPTYNYAPRGPLDARGRVRA
jgi:hypothetical protein